MAEIKDNIAANPSEESLELFMKTILSSIMNNQDTSTPEHSSPPLSTLEQSLTPYIQTISLFIDSLQGTITGTTKHLLSDSSLNEAGNTTEENPSETTTEQLQKWTNLGCEYSKRLLSESVSLLSDPTQRYHGLIEQVTTLSKSLVQGDSNTASNLLSSHLSLMLKQLELSENTIRRLSGAKIEPVVRPCKTDHRFTDSEWESNVVFDFIKQSYLLNSQAVMSLTDHINIDPQNKALLGYCLRQISSALSPSNFALANPEVLRKIKETNGENIYLGVKQLLEDQAKSPQFLNICMSDNEKFQLGKNIATTSGKVVYENELMQLIQYQATTAKTRTIPILMIPSWINKYYILDLSPSNSFVQWNINKGHTVFMISWINPDQSHRHIDFEDYLRLGILSATDAIEKITGEQQVNAVGYCLGGILLATAMAYFSHHKQNRIATATYLATSLDYTDPGDISIFCNERTVKYLEEMMEKEGYLDGRLLSVTFNLLRENELYWNYYIQNYLKGERPKAFDVLHWNSDNTNVPAKTHSFVLRDLHLNNGLIEKDTITLLGTPIDLKQINNPTYILATDKDHIAKWESAYSATQLYSGDKRFVLAGSGHIAGVINPPISNKYYYHINTDLPESPKNWLSSATKTEGSWWNDWFAWIDSHGGPHVKARIIPEEHIVENAPGRYVQRRLV